MNNHIIVGESRRCVCGVYAHHPPVGCREVIAALELVHKMTESPLVSTKEANAIRLLNTVITPLIKNCD
jgi:predicted nucleic acid-binding Zn ribbon protein